MRTLSDLHRTFELLESQAPPELPDAASLTDLARAARTRRRRRTVAGALTAVAAAVAVTLAVIAPQPHRHQHPQPARPGPATCDSPAHCPVLGPDGKPARVATSFTLGARPGSGWTAVLQSIDTGTEQMIMARNAPGSGQADVTSYRPTALQPRYTVQAPVTVDGHKGNYVTFGLSATHRGIVWSAIGRTFIVDTLLESTTPASRVDDVLMSAAQAVQQAPQPVAMPFRFDTLPAGLVPERVVQTLDGPPTADVGFTDGAATQQTSQPIGAAAVYVTLTLPLQADTLSSQAVAGNRVYTSPGLVQVQIDARTTLTIQVNPARLTSYSTPRLIEIARHITLATDPTKRSTWFTQDVFPNR